MKKQIIALGFGLLALQMSAMEDPRNHQKRLDDQLWEAFGKSDKPEMRRLLKAGANPNSRRDGSTLLHVFARGNYNTDLEEGDILVNHGADINALDARWWTPFGWARAGDDSQMGGYLTGWFYNKNAIFDQGSCGKTYLHSYAGAWYDLNALKKEMKFAPKAIHAKDGDGNMPLHEAAYYGNLEAVKLLIKAGAKVNAKNKKGETPLSKAKYSKHKEIIQFLKSKGAK